MFKVVHVWAAVLFLYGTEGIPLYLHSQFKSERVADQEIFEKIQRAIWTQTSYRRRGLISLFPQEVCPNLEYISCKKFRTLNFEHFWSHFGQISDNNVGHSAGTKFSPTKHEFDRNSVWENYSFTAASRFTNTPTRKITHYIKPRILMNRGVSF